MITAEILEIRPAARPVVMPPRRAAAGADRAEFLRLFGLDRLPRPRRLVCRWHCDAEGRLAGSWEADIGPVSLT